MMIVQCLVQQEQQQNDWIRDLQSGQTSLLPENRGGKTEGVIKQ